MMTLDAYQRAVALAYDQAPLYHIADERCWDLLADETMALYEKVAGSIRVVPVANAEPYPTALAMMVDVAHGRLFVSDVHHDHPVWTPEVNRAFRVVHDVVGHCSTGSGFDWAGELKAWERHEQTVVSTEARRALFTEAVGQVAWMLHPAFGGGAFGKQKVATLPQWLQWESIDTRCAA